MESPLLEPRVWKACAGSLVQIPTVNSRVYFFPQGHLDEAFSPPQNLSSNLLSTPYIICTVAVVQFQPEVTDEVVALLLLVPIDGDFPASASLPSVPNPADYDDEDDNDDGFASFATILTHSDVNGGGGDGFSLPSLCSNGGCIFSVPTPCANAIFPVVNLTNLEGEEGRQVLKVTDLQGNTWKFLHIYDGNSQRHFLTTGWTRFVDDKELVPGDTVVFIKNSEQNISIGIRRAVSQLTCYGSDTSCYHGNPSSNGSYLTEWVAKETEIAALKLYPFHVVYHPRGGWSDFVVRAEVVEKALNVEWRPGMRVKMPVKTVGQITWCQGIISSIVINGKHPWQGSPWRIFRITWDEDERMKYYRWVSPWEVFPVHRALPIEGIANLNLDDSCTGMKLLDRLRAQCQSGTIVQEEFDLGN